MLGAELGRKGVGTNVAQLNVVLIVAKILRSIAVCQAFSNILFSYDFPVTLFTFYTLVFSSSILLLLQQPWNGRKQIQPNQWAQIGFYSVLLLLNFIFWNLGLKYYGPTRTILASDHADLVLGVMFTAFFSSKGKNMYYEKVRGAMLLAVAYLLLFWVEPATVSEPSIGEGVIPTTPNPRAFHFGFIYIPETKVGGACLFIAVVLSMFRDLISKKLYPDIGGVKRLYALSTPIAAAVCFPFAVFSYFTTTSVGTIFSWDVSLGVVAMALFGVVMEFYIESMLSNQMSIASISSTSLVTSFITVCVYEWLWGVSSPSWMTFLCFFLILWGTGMVFQKPVMKSDLPLFTGTKQTMTASTFLKFAMRQILDGKESRRIFFYLCLNLLFMFVECVYGWITNSLGLMSDSAHMLFDCTALAIGLFAAVISKWDANEIHSYGWARVEVLSGFINGIFLVFIGFLVLLESSERFFHPQEINTDKLMLVSCLGLAVNLVGLFAFHDLHDHGDEDDHGHSHGHSHGHDHAHGHKEKKEKKEKHSHGHDHHHENDHDHDHQHSHAHNHERNDEAINENRLGVFLHILADTLGSVGVIISSYFVQYHGWISADPICSFFISLLIFMSVGPFLYGSAGTLLQQTPQSLEKKLDKCLQKIQQLEGVVGYSNPHFWRYAKSMIVGTIHIQISGDMSEQSVLSQVSKILKKKAGVKNLTVEITRVS